MTTHDEIPDSGSGSGSAKPAPVHRQLREVGPEAEARGGPETPDTGLNVSPPGMPPNAVLGQRDALPAGSLPGPYLETQGDENREPPPNAPAPVNGIETVADARRAAAAKEQSEHE